MPIIYVLYYSTVYPSAISHTYISTSTSSDGVITLGVLGGVWLILLTVTVIVLIYYFLRFVFNAVLIIGLKYLLFHNLECKVLLLPNKQS